MLLKGSQQFYQTVAFFCHKTKYKPNTKTRETMHSVQEFRADKTVRKCAQLHMKLCTNVRDITERVMGVCAIDLICSEVKYHASCSKRFVRIQCACDTGQVQFLVVMIMNCSQHMMQSMVLAKR